MSTEPATAPGESPLIPGFPDVRPERVGLWFGLIAAALLTVHLVLQAIQNFGGGVNQLILDRFNVNVEQSFPTWYSSSTLLVCAGVVAVIARHRRGMRFARHWWGLALGFLALSAEEIAGVHDAINTASVSPWTLPGSIVVLFLALLYLRFLAELPPRTRVLFVIAGAFFVGGIIGIEQAEQWFSGDADPASFRYALWSAGEEGAEMTGAVLFLYALLDYIQGTSASKDQSNRPGEQPTGPVSPAS